MGACLSRKRARSDLWHCSICNHDFDRNDPQMAYDHYLYSVRYGGDWWVIRTHTDLLLAHFGYEG